jgi:3-hydroxy-9,10-secoandrosta-1,3,5(10)-triene-9,17-dione monooxygenase reductase component
MNDPLILPDQKYDPEVLRQVMRGWAGGVTVVTSLWNKTRHGMTVNAFSSVSLDPPVILVALASRTRTCRLVRQSGVFAITILAEGMEPLSDRFAGRTIPDLEDRFTGLETFNLVTGCPLINGGLAHLDCRVRDTYEVGMTTVFFGDVVAGRVYEAGRPLVYFNRLYRRLQ